VQLTVLMIKIVYAQSHFSVIHSLVLFYQSYSFKTGALYVNVKIINLK